MYRFDSSASFVKGSGERDHFENCVADVNIPVGEVFTSPVLEGTNGLLHVSKVYLNELQYQDLKITFANGMIADYNCKNFERELKIKEYIKEHVLHRQATLPLESLPSEQIRPRMWQRKNTVLRTRCRFSSLRRWDLILQ